MRGCPVFDAAVWQAERTLVSRGNPRKVRDLALQILRRALVCLLFASPLASCTFSFPQASPSPTPTPVSVIRVSGSGTALPLVQTLAEAYTKKHPDAQFQFLTGTNSGGAITGVITGTLEIAAVNRPLSADEAKEAIAYQPIARDPVVFATHQPNPVQGLTTTQIRDIFAGKITNWGEVGGKPAPIILLDRDKDESARKLGLIPLLNHQEVTARVIVLTSSGDMVKNLDNTQDSLGYCSLGVLQISKPANVKVLAIDGVTPGPASIKNGTYPLSLTLGLVYRRNSPVKVRQFADFVKGHDGRKVLEEHNYAETKN